MRNFLCQKILPVLALLWTVGESHAFYDPTVGRWASRDPITERGGLNIGAFLSNDGLNRIDYLGFASYSATDQLWAKTSFPVLPVNYPRKGNAYCCRGKKVGDVQLKYAFIDASVTQSMKSSTDPLGNTADTFSDLYDQIANWSKISSKALGDLPKPGYLGAGVIVDFVPTQTGKTCCKSFRWENIKLPNIPDGAFPAGPGLFIDFPGLAPIGLNGSDSRSYYLKLICVDWGDQLWAMNWSFQASWANSPRRTATVTLTIPY